MAILTAVLIGVQDHAVLMSWFLGSINMYTHARLIKHGEHQRSKHFFPPRHEKPHQIQNRSDSVRNVLTDMADQIVSNPLPNVNLLQSGQGYRALLQH